MICPQQNNTIGNKKNLRYVRNPQIAERSIDDSVFLVNPDTDIVYYLNPLGTGIWQLLREPISVLDAAGIVQKAFPDLPLEKIAEDVAKLINTMSKKNLILNHDSLHKPPSRTVRIKKVLPLPGDRDSFI